MTTKTKLLEVINLLKQTPITDWEYEEKSHSYEFYHPQTAISIILDSPAQVLLLEKCSDVPVRIYEEDLSKKGILDSLWSSLRKKQAQNLAQIREREVESILDDVIRQLRTR